MTPFSMQKLGCNAELIVDEFGEKLLEELDYAQEARNIEARLEPCVQQPALVAVVQLLPRPGCSPRHLTPIFSECC